ncbi:MAG: HAD family hydrolase [Candidatus Paceibacterales bacterium]
MLNKSRAVGIDFDNTLINYDEVFFNHALSLNLIGPGTKKNKKEVRDQIRLLADGEIIWQKIQAFVYSRGIAGACLNQGAEDFLRTCSQQGIKVYVVSHKTEFSRFDATRVNLRRAALDWMTANHFFMEEGLGLHKDQVYFEATRSQKIGRLQSLGCTHFIDDLEEVFLEKTFPEDIEKILFAPQGDSSISGDVKVFKSWGRIYEYFFR